MENEKGLLISFEGCDGVGKETQCHLLVARLKKEGFPVNQFGFPDYESRWGKEIRRILYESKDKNLKLPDPFEFGLLYANDRLEKKELIQSWLDAGNIVILDRFMESNLAHQAAKFTDEKQRLKLINHFLSLEYNTNKLPRPNIVLLIDLPPTLVSIARNLDANEADLQYQQAVRKVYHWLHQNHKKLSYNKWEKIECSSSQNNQNKRLLPEEIAEKVYSSVKPFLPS